MATARDWLHTLWNASYKGTPFKVERDSEDGGRRIVIHQFPMRDDPYLEDLGEDKRGFEITAYVASDSADTEAAAVVATCATRGAGILVLPTHGPLLVRCLTFERDRAKDKHGHIALSLKFVREGASTALATVLSLANNIFVAADSLAAAAAAAFASATLTANQPDFVNDAAVSGVQNNASALEAIRSTAPIDPVVSRTQRDAIQSIFDNAGTIITPPEAKIWDGVTIPPPPAIPPAQDLASQIVSSARALGDAMSPADAISNFEAVLVDFNVVIPTPAFATPSALAAAQNEDAANRIVRLAAFTVYSEGIAQVKLTDRPSALTLRANVAEHFEDELESLSAGDTDLAHALTTMRDAVIDYLSRAVLDLAPVLTVEANLVKCSLFWAWRLYADPARSQELVARNRVIHPSFMPTAFEALAK